MTREQRNFLCELMRKHTRLRMDYFHLMGIALTAQQTGKFPDDLLIKVRMLRDSAESRGVIEKTEALLAHVLQTVDEDAMMQLIAGIAKEDIPN